MSFRRLVPLIGLSAVTFLIWCAFTHRWSVEAWRTPLELHGDPLEIYARVKIAAEDLTQPLHGYAHLPRLGAPVSADWQRYPISDRVVFTLLGALARLIGVFAAVNLAIAAVHVLNALSFYLCARFLRWRREWAFALALLFSFSSFNFRWGITVSLSLTFWIPPFLLLCGWIARNAPAVRSRAWTWLAIGLGVGLGGGNPYFCFFAAQLAGWSVVLQLLRRRDPARWRAGVGFVVALVVSFLLHNAPYFLVSTEGDARLTLARNYAGSEIYALKFTDLVIPPAAHSLERFARIGRDYQAQSALRSEFFVNYLGFAGIAGLLLLGWTSLRGLARSRRIRIPDAALGVGWTLLFSMPGGINSLLALAGLDVFRASNRNSVFILVWSLWFFGRVVQRRSLRPLIGRFALPAAVAALGVVDSLPWLDFSSVLRSHMAALRDARSLANQLETRLGNGARIFQIPAPVFPEAGIVGQMFDYEHFLPFLTSHSLRFSYGALRGTELADALTALAHAPPALMKETLEAVGFSAVWIDRRGLPDRGKALVDAFRSLNVTEIPQNTAPDIILFALAPARTPTPFNTIDPRLYPAWDAANPTTPKIGVVDGWYPLEHVDGRAWRWAEHAATVSLAVPTPTTVALSFRGYSLRRGQLALELDGVEIWREPSSSKTRAERHVTLSLQPGTHRLIWRFHGPLRRASPTDRRQIGFGIENLTVR
jgi:hypothetical protein